MELSPALQDGLGVLAKALAGLIDQTTLTQKAQYTRDFGKPLAEAAAADKPKETVKVDTKKTPAKDPAGTATASPSTSEAQPADTQTEETAKVELAGDASTSEASAYVLNDYEPLQKAILRLVPKDKAKAVAILGKFGAAKGTDVKATDWGACYVEFLNALGEEIPATADAELA